jgi:dinuclear metal center YbgI/SA1388 family protein
MATVSDVMSVLQTLAPLSLAAEWDNVGLLLGDQQASVQRVMTCLTVTPDSVAEAVEANAQLIISHHPILFRAAKKLTTSTPEGRMILNLAQAGIAVYSAHTAFDNAVGGINDQLAEKLGLAQVRPLRTTKGPEQCKIVVFVPDKDLTRVSDAMFAAGAGQIGQYRECSFRLAGTGTFFGTDATNPTIGEKGRREEVTEWRLELVCLDAQVERVVAAMRSAHSYEEPAYDVYPLRPETAKIGEGRIGLLSTPTSLQEFAKTVRSVLRAPAVQMVGSSGQSVQRVAIACGSAGEFLSHAVASKADVFLTGEMSFHQTLAAQAQPIGLVLPGHYATERCGMESLAEQLQREFPTLKVWASQRERDSLEWVTGKC